MAVQHPGRPPAADPPFARLGIVGLGLMGGSVALAARRAWPNVTVLGLERHGRASEAASRGVIDDVVGELRDVARADLVVLAGPVAAMIDLLPRFAELDTKAIVTDVGSTKRRVMAAAAGMTRFVGGHPMAGSERAGLDEARVDLFDGRPWLLVRGRAGEAAAARVERFAAGLGARPLWIDADAHDRTVAYISHLPQLISVALMNAAQDAVGDDGLKASGRAFAEMTRLAASPADLWQGILSENADFVEEALARFTAHLPSGREAADERWVRAAFDRSLASKRRMNGA